jgi:hypothetical protein
MIAQTKLLAMWNDCLLLVQAARDRRPSEHKAFSYPGDIGPWMLGRWFCCGYSGRTCDRSVRCAAILRPWAALGLPMTMPAHTVVGHYNEFWAKEQRKPFLPKP